ncbi:MAG TPA: pepsin/retropepsin-like aspartic protease family protein [Candidatus Baltobacteraceae bacterium]|nr:pepsin/retropepsin-like aspartic protease family protein [Candidatus Baltobacteraceae bacterium]
MSTAVAFCIAVAGCTIPLIAAASNGVTVPFTYHDNRILIRANIDGEGPFWLILDTGSSRVAITPGVARRLNLAVRDNGTVTGGGNGAAHVGAAVLRTVTLGTLSEKDVKADVLDLGVIRTKFRFPHLDGIVGYPFLSHYVTFINVDDGTITFSSTAPPEPGNATTTSFDGVLPIVKGSIDGVSTKILVDSGDRSSLTVFAPFAKSQGLYGKYPSRADIVTGYGVGGPIHADIFTLPTLNVLGTRFQHVVARASRATGGAFASVDQGGSIGTGILKRFNTVYDYKHKTIVAWPSKYFKEPFEFVPPGS